MACFLSFITYLQLQRTARTDRLLAIFHLGATTGSGDALYHQRGIACIGQHQAALLLFRLGETTEIQFRLVDGNLCYARGRLRRTSARHNALIKFLHPRIEYRIAQCHHLVFLVQQQSLESDVRRETVQAVQFIL